MRNSSFAKAVKAAPITVNGSLLMREGAIFSDEVNLTGATVGSNLEMASSLFMGNVDVDSSLIYERRDVLA
jgi:hypothetical protein